MRYLQRSLKYFLSLSFFYFAVMYIFSFATNAVFTPGAKFHAVISTPRGCFLIFALVVLSAVYPYFGYMKRVIDGDLVRHREQIIRCFAAQNMTLDHESEGRMTFRANNIFRRISLLFEDHVKIIQDGDGKLAVIGNRKKAAYVIYLLVGAIEAVENGDEAE